MPRRRTLQALLIAACAAPAMAADTLSLSCPVCHGSRAAPSSMPGPYGLAAGEIETLLRDYRSGARAGTAMPRLTASLSDIEIHRLAEHYGESRP